MAILVRRLEKPGALVSRSDSRQLRSGYVILEPGKEVGEHTTEDGEELIVIVDGKADVVSDGRTHVVEAPCVVLIPTNTIHNVKNKSEALLRYVYVVVASPDLKPRRAPAQ
jgi:quercetin dioxygenase-like cupin family protein